jgi:branched-chain amino acid transport system permease protein
VKDPKKVWISVCLVGLSALVPLLTRSEYFINLLIMFFLYVTLSQSWNLLGGFNGQISLGHSAFFGIGALITRLLWVSKVPIPLAFVGGGLSSVILGGIVGIPCLRMKRGYFPIGTLGLGIIAQITVGNIFPVPGSLPSEYIVGYSLFSRYYFALSVAILSLLVVYYVVRSRTGLALVAIRDDEEAAEAVGIKTFRYKVKALLISSFLAGLGGSVFAYHQVSYYYQSPFELSWSFLPTLTTFIGGLGTIIGPIIGSVCFLALNELFAFTLGEVHLVIFGFTFILIVLFVPGGLMSITQMIHPFFKYFAKSGQAATFPNKKEIPEES